MFDATPRRPAFDPELVPVLDAMRANMPPFTLDTLPEVRRLMTEGAPGMEALDLTAAGAVQVEERTVPGPGGAPDITLLVLRPAVGEGPWPAIYHMHGGGMVLGDRRTGVAMFLPHIVEIGAVVVSVEYRLAPEHPDPAPVEDCYAGLAWTAKHAEELSIDPSRIMIAGSSAGGGLAAGTALLARDRGFPELAHQVLMSPMLDDRFETASSRMLDGEGTWDRNDNMLGWSALLGDRRGGPDVSPYAAPARAENLSGLPKTYIDVGSVESFRDEAIIHAQRLSEAGVSVDFHLWGGGFHGFEGTAPHAAVVRACNGARDAFIRRALTT
jgi:acetyl esterase/lipase